MIQLGISAFYHDSAACIVVDGIVKAASEEERYTGIKHDYSFPINAIKYCLEYTGLDISDINEVNWYEQPDVKADRVSKIFSKHPFKTFFLKRKFKKEQHNNSPEKLLKDLGYTGIINYVPHHLSHAAFSFYTSPYKESDILVIDGVGEWDTVSFWRGDDKGIHLKHSYKFPNSLGMFYSTMTAYLGFKPNEGEWKVMGLAPYGNPAKYYDKLAGLIKETGFRINQKYFTWEYSDKVMFNSKLSKLLDLPPRLPEEPFTKDHENLAAATQALYEYHFLKFVEKSSLIGDGNNLCLGGGCAYNGVANSKVYKFYKSTYIPYAPSDAGSAIGACLYNYKGPKRENINPFLGDNYDSAYCLDILKSYNSKVNFVEFDREVLSKRVAKLLQAGKIVAWFNGRMEFGARALGNRSILASPYNAKMRDKLNYVVKKREGFRPFAPSVMQEEAGKYFVVRDDIPYMNQVVKVKRGSKDLFPAATHIDETARVHSVTKNQNKDYYLLLRDFKVLTGHGVLLNTSFNLKDETITRTPDQAIERFLGSDIDYLVLENYLVIKK
jgi:carbamoyltransferase